MGKVTRKRHTPEFKAILTLAVRHGVVWRGTCLDLLHVGAAGPGALAPEADAVNREISAQRHIDPKLWR